MAIFQQCPICRLKQKNALKKCRKCGEDLVKAKRSQRVKYWIAYPIPGGKYKWQCIGTSLSQARDADGKIRAEKRENPFFDVKNNRLTFQELTDWYLNLQKVKKKKYFPTLTYRLNKWNMLFGDTIITHIKKSDIDNHQEMRVDAGWAASTIDQEIGAVKTMIQAAIDDDKIDANIIKPFRKIERLLKANSNARDRIITIDEFYRLLETVPDYTQGIISLGFFGGMRLGEILELTWDKVFLGHEIPHIKLEKDDTKEGKGKVIPLATGIKGNPYEILKAIPRGLHDDHVFLYQGKPVSRIRDGFKKACDDIGLVYGRFVKGGFIFHDLRHCFSTYMRRAGNSETTIMKIMGHSPGKGLEMHFRYSTFELDDLKVAIENLENYFTAILPNINHGKP